MSIHKYDKNIINHTKKPVPGEPSDDTNQSSLWLRVAFASFPLGGLDLVPKSHLLTVSTNCCIRI